MKHTKPDKNVLSKERKCLSCSLINGVRESVRQEDTDDFFKKKWVLFAQNMRQKQISLTEHKRGTHLPILNTKGLTQTLNTED